MRREVLLRVDWRWRQMRFYYGWNWWVHIIIQIDELLLLLNTRRHHHRRLLHHENLLRENIVGDFLRLITQCLAHINTSQIAVVIDMKVEIGRKFKLIW